MCYVDLNIKCKSNIKCLVEKFKSARKVKVTLASEELLGHV